MPYAKYKKSYKKEIWTENTMIDQTSRALLYKYPKINNKHNNKQIPSNIVVSSHNVIL